MIRNLARSDGPPMDGETRSADKHEPLRGVAAPTNASRMRRSAILAEVLVEHDAVGQLQPIKLPSTLWGDGLRIGDRVIVETTDGDVVAGEIEADTDDAPIVVVFAGFPQSSARTVRVRRPRGGA